MIIFPERSVTKMTGPTDEYQDLLDPRRKQFDINFAFKHRASLLPEYQYVTHMSNADIKNMVLRSRRLKHTIEEVRLQLSVFNKNDTLNKDFDKIGNPTT